MKSPKDLTDDELFAEIREQVNNSRNSVKGHDRKRTRLITEEMKRRGWGVNYSKDPAQK